MKKIAIITYATLSFLMLFGEPNFTSNLVTVIYYALVLLNLYNAVRIINRILEHDRELIKQAHLSGDWDEVAKMKGKAFSSEAKEIIGDRAKHLYRKEEWLAETL